MHVYIVYFQPEQNSSFYKIHNVLASCKLYTQCTCICTVHVYYIYMYSTCILYIHVQYMHIIYTCICTVHA